MLLSDFDGRFFDVIRDGEFTTLGNVTSSPDAPCLTFVTNEHFLTIACKKQIFSCFICPRDLVPKLPPDANKRGIAAADDPKSAFQLFHNWLVKQDAGYAVPMAKTVIGSGCIIDKSAHISPVGVTIGNYVTIESNVIIEPGVCIEDGVYISGGAVVGASCLLVGTMPDGSCFRLTQAGRTLIRENASLAHYAYIGRGMFPYECTIIGKNTHVGYVVEVSHNCSVGNNCVILDHALICGNAVVEDGVRVAPHAVISNRLHIGTGVVVDIGSVVVNNVRSGLRVAGNFAIEHSKFLLWHKNKLKVKSKTLPNKDKPQASLPEKSDPV